MTDYQSSDKTMDIITEYYNTICLAVIIIMFTYSNNMFLFTIFNFMYMSLDIKLSYHTFNLIDTLRNVSECNKELSHNIFSNIEAL